MYKAKVFIKGEGILYDNEVCVAIELPSIPRKDEYLFMSPALVKELEDMARKDVDKAAIYAPEYFFGRSSDCINPKEENLADLSFEEANLVYEVFYVANDEYVYIVLAHIY